MHTAGRVAFIAVCLTILWRVPQTRTLIWGARRPGV